MGYLKYFTAPQQGEGEDLLTRFSDIFIMDLELFKVDYTIATHYLLMCQITNSWSKVPPPLLSLVDYYVYGDGFIYISVPPPTYIWDTRTGFLNMI